MTENIFKHKSVLLDESVDWLVNDLSGIYVDCTLGGAGHSLAIAEKLSKDAVIIGIDQDEDALKAAKGKLQKVNCRTFFVKSNFSNLKNILEELGFPKVNGIIFDLGVSSYQLDTPKKGFSYMHDGALDMRMDNSINFSAKDIINKYSEEKLADIILRYGEERWSKRVAQFIVLERQKQEINTTYQLVEIIKKAIPKGARKDGPHPAKRTFQAIRIEVNNELGILEKSFTDAADCLITGGKLAIITFHSLEDRIAKQTLSYLGKSCECPKSLPVCMCNKKAVLKDIKVKKPSLQEIELNHRARSAKLRIATKI